MREDPHPRPTTLRAVIDDAAERQGENTFIVSPDTGRVVDYATLRSDVRGLARGLRAQGLRRGDRVAYLLDNGPFTAELFLATLYGGFVSVPLNPIAGSEQLRSVLRVAEPNVVFVSPKYQPALYEGRSDDLPVRVVSEHEGWQGSDADNIELPDIDANSDALLIFTSGSTGKPKGVPGTHRNVLSAASNVIAAHELSPDDRTLCVLPLCHVNALMNSLLGALASGGGIVLPQRFVPRRFWSWIEDHQCTWAALVPTIIAQLLAQHARREAAPAAPTNLPLRFVRSSSAALPPDQHAAFEQRFRVPLLECMGSTETFGDIFTSPLAGRKIGSVGTPWKLEVKISDARGHVHGDRKTGEVAVRGPSVMSGYLGGDASVFDDAGWLRTGDLAYRDEDGFYFLVGRSKELIIKAGENIAPREIDDAVASHPAVLEAAAVGVRDRYFGEDIEVHVVLEPGATADEQAILDWCRGKLGDFKTPRRAHFVDALPKGPSGKVQRLRLRTHADVETDSRMQESGGERPRPAARSTDPPRALDNRIRAIWCEVLGFDSIGAHDSFFALGGYSLLAVMILSRIRRDLGVELSLSDFFDAATVARFSELVEHRLGTQMDPPVVARAAPAGPTPEILPLSAAQFRVFFLEVLNPGTVAYNEAEAVRLRGILDPHTMEGAISKIVARHDALRTAFVPAEDDIPHQVVRDRATLPLERIDLAPVPAGAREHELESVLNRLARLPFDLESAPLARSALVSLDDETHVFVLVMHHLVCDRTSIGLFARELAALYNARGGEDPLPALTAQFGDFSRWQGAASLGPAHRQDLDYWADWMRGAPAVSTLSSPGQRPAVPRQAGARHRFRIGPPLSLALRRFATTHASSPFMICAAAFNALFYRLTEQADIVLGIAVDRRDEPQWEGVIGFMVDTQVLRTRLSGDSTFIGLLHQVRDSLLHAHQHLSVQFDELVRVLKPARANNRTPLCQILLNWRRRDARLDSMKLQGIDARLEPVHNGAAKFDLTLFFEEVGEALECEIEYSTELYDDAFIGGLVAQYRCVLSGAIADAGCAISSLPMPT